MQASGKSREGFTGKLQEGFTGSSEEALTGSIGKPWGVPTKAFRTISQKCLSWKLPRRAQAIPRKLAGMSHRKLSGSPQASPKEV